jgi:ketosteroid isomerase-like protein
MQTTAFFLFFATIAMSLSGQRAFAKLPPGGGIKSPDGEIRLLLDQQTEAWNRGDIEAFMAGYWNSDETEFVGANGVSRGWQALLERYRKNYPDRKAMGRLSFSNLEIHMVCADAAYAIGRFKLEREDDRPTGFFTLNFRRFAEGWRIVADHTTGSAAVPAKSQNRATAGIDLRLRPAAPPITTFRGQ